MTKKELEEENKWLKGLVSDLVSKTNNPGDAAIEAAQGLTRQESMELRDAPMSGPSHLDKLAEMFFDISSAEDMREDPNGK